MLPRYALRESGTYTSTMTESTAQVLWSNVRRHAVAVMLSALVASQAFAGAFDVSDDELYSDGVTLTTADGSPLDINGDGHVDLVVASNSSSNEERSRYYLGNGDGTFQEAVLLTFGPTSHTAAADMNGDTFVDLVQGRRDRTDLLYLGDGAGALAAGIAISPDEYRVLELAIGDLDGDGDLDVVTANGREAADIANPPQPNRYYLNDSFPGGTLTFAGNDISADADVTRTIALADLDGDGDLDIIVGNDETTLNSNRIYLNQFIESGSVALSFAPGFDFGPSDDQTAKIVIGDLNNDGKPDIVVLNHVKSPESPGMNRFFLNESTTGVLQLSAAIDIGPDMHDSSDGVLADFDGDGDLDLAVSNLLSADGQSPRNRLYLNQFIESGIASFDAGRDLSADEQRSRTIAAADLNGDGHIDLIVGNQNNFGDASGRDRRYLNNGTDDPFANIVPVIGAAAPLETDENAPLELTLDDLEVTDPDNVFPHDFTLTVQPGTNYIVADRTITPDAGFTGELTVPVTVNDGTDESESFDLTVTVHNTINTAPSFTSTPVEEATQDIAYTYDITASDPDSGDTLSITAPSLPVWLAFDDNGDGTATLSGTPEAADVGEHDVTLEVSDGIESAAQTFTITVEAVEPPPPPPPPPSPPPSGGGGGGGAESLLSLLVLGAFGAVIRRRRIFRRSAR